MPGDGYVIDSLIYQTCKAYESGHIFIPHNLFLLLYYSTNSFFRTISYYRHGI